MKQERSLMVNVEGRMELEKRVKILFLCTGNSCRSQMAEGWARCLKGNLIDAYSAGIEAHGTNPKAVKVMAEVGVDISHQVSKKVTDLIQIRFDYVITVCDNAKESCPLFPGNTKVLHVGFEDPAYTEKKEKTEENKINCYRRVRDEIKMLIEQLPAKLFENNTEVSK